MNRADIDHSAEVASLHGRHQSTAEVIGADYPPVLVAPGALDEITPPVHAYKFTAALQHGQQCSNPVLMRVSSDAGHAYGGTPEETAASFAAQLVFLQKFLDGSRTTAWGMKRRKAQLRYPAP
jgi:fermentation-respiration switch protein FrsA (DUF1100 family)